MIEARDVVFLHGAGGPVEVATWLEPLNVRLVQMRVPAGFRVSCIRRRLSRQRSSPDAAPVTTSVADDTASSRV